MSSRVSLSPALRHVSYNETLKWNDSQLYVGYLVKIMKRGLMKDEIQQQPDMLLTLWKEEHDNIVNVANHLTNANRVVLTGSGDSLAAALCGYYFFLPSGLGRVSHADPMYLSTYLVPFMLPNDFIIAITVSGRTPRVLEVVKRAKTQDVQTIGITDDPDSPLARLADHVIFIRSSNKWHPNAKPPNPAMWEGYDQPVPQTKTFLATIHALYMLGSATLRNDALHQATKVTVPMVADLVSEEYFQAVSPIVKKWKKNIHVYVAGNGATFGVAMYGANKFLEYAQKATATTIEDFCHTHFWSLKKHDVVIFLPASDRDVERVKEIIPALISLKVIPIVIYGQDSPIEDAVFLPLPAFLDPRVMPMISTIPVQILAFWFGIHHCPNPNAFRGGKDAERWSRLAKQIIRESRIDA